MLTWLITLWLPEFPVSFIQIINLCSSMSEHFSSLPSTLTRQIRPSHLPNWPGFTNLHNSSSRLIIVGLHNCFSSHTIASPFTSWHLGKCYSLPRCLVFFFLYKDEPKHFKSTSFIKILILILSVLILLDFSWCSLAIYLVIQVTRSPEQSLCCA